MNRLSRIATAIALIAPIAGAVSMLSVGGWLGEGPRLVDQAEAKETLYKDSAAMTPSQP
jgi:hypothetical protein